MNLENIDIKAVSNNTFWGCDLSFEYGTEYISIFLGPIT